MLCPVLPVRKNDARIIMHFYFEGLRDVSFLVAWSRGEGTTNELKRGLLKCQKANVCFTCY